MGTAWNTNACPKTMPLAEQRHNTWRAIFPFRCTKPHLLLFFQRFWLKHVSIHAVGYMTVWALRSLPATRIRWNSAAWMCHTLISTWKRHHFCWSPILLLPKWYCFRALGNIGFVASFDETPWFRSDFCLTRPCAGEPSETSDRSSSGADLSGTAWQNIWKHRETLHFYMLLGAWFFSWCKEIELL